MIEDQVEALLSLPKPEQPAGLTALLDSWPPAGSVPEIWNTSFGPGSLFDAWTSTSIAQGLYAANSELLRPHLDKRENWRVVEVGGGDGKLWVQTLRANDVGEIVVVDPVADAFEQVKRIVPSGVTVRWIEGFVQDVVLPECDVIVCSLTLHHVAGADSDQRLEYGLSGPGKLEVLSAFRAALEARDGIGLVNEADMMCDLDMPAADPQTRENVFDSYVRRCGPGIIRDIRTRGDADDDLRARWRNMLRHWFVEQTRMAELPLAERDIYELPVVRWLALFGRAGLSVDRHRCTDDCDLFWQYAFSVRR